MVQVHIMIFMILTILFVLGVVDLGSVIIIMTLFLILIIGLEITAITKVLCKVIGKVKCQIIFTLALQEDCFPLTMEQHHRQGLLHKGVKQWVQIKWQHLPEVE
jgi:hypothetical protein